MISVFNRLISGLKNYLSPHPREVLTASAPVEAREKTLFIDVQRRLMIYLRALWDCEFVMQQAVVDSVGDEVYSPFIEYSVIHVPTAFFDCAPDGVRHVTGLEIYRAAAVHAAAHLIYTKKNYSARSLDKLQIAMIAVIEDARVETLSIRSFPGLKHLWMVQHTATPGNNLNGGDYLNRLARALLDDTYQDDDPWISQGRALFNSVEDMEDARISRDIGIKLADSFREKKIKLEIHEDTPGASYRDDNRFLWRSQSRPLEIFSPLVSSKSSAGVEDSDRKLKKRPASTPAELANDMPAIATYFYPEWNYRTRSEDQSWVTLRERNSVAGDLKIINNIIAENRHLISRMKAILRAIREGAPHRVRKLEEGEDIDINAAIRARIDIRQGMPPDTRIMVRSARKSRDISVLMLLDLSRSMNDMIQETMHNSLQLTRQASVLFAEALQAIGDPFAIHGFNSDGRHFVEYFRLKDFGQPYDEVPKASIAGMKGKNGTRMGAAVRHATHYLNKLKSNKKLLLIMTDGEPNDNDTPSRKYLHDDTRKSVEDARRNGIHTYCISLDPDADKYVSRIFGATNYMVVDHVKHLPEKVLLIYAGLTR